MRILLRALRYLLVFIFLVAILGSLTGWWLLRRTLPQVDGTAVLPELQHEVTVDRDAWGVPHIRASSLGDLLTAQGYVIAQDRLWQMDILRRLAAGELSEIFGPGTLELDRQYRILGLHVAAEREAENLNPEVRGILEAYARGVNRYIDERQGALPWEFTRQRSNPRPWKPSDSLLIAGYMYQTLTNTWGAELKRARVTELAGPDRARELFLTDSAFDHVIVDSTAPEAPSPAKKAKHKKRTAPHAQIPQLPRIRATFDETQRAWNAAETFLEQFDEEVRAAIGSNNWVVDGKHTASGKPLLANDTHLQLSAPSIWYILHLTAPGWNVKGFALPGAPGIIIGHNDRIAWGFTNNGADVEDLYIETFHPERPLDYLVNGKYVQAEVRTERIHVLGQEDTVLDVYITRHGPVVRSEGTRKYALKWTALEPGGLAGLYSLLGRAQNWGEFREALRQIPGPAQNIVYADVDGNIGFIVAARIPVRKKGDGALPVPGDTDDYEWTGYIPFDELPQVLNPPGGVIATANARVVGPGYPHYLTDRWASPWRTARIYDLLAQKKKLQPADCLAIQDDIVSLPHRFLAEQMVRASHSTNSPAHAKDPRARELLARLVHWDGRAKAESIETAFVEYTRRFFMASLLRPVLGREITLYEWRDSIFLDKVLRERPAHWLPPEFHSYEEMLMAAADEAVKHLASDTKQPKPAGWRWGQLNALLILHPLGRTGWMQRLLSIGPTDQAGTIYTVKVAQPSHGPAMRYVADLSNFDNSLMNVTLGQSGQFGSPHYRDQFRAWFEGRGIPAPFSEAAEEKARKHRLHLLPEPNH